MYYLALIPSEKEKMIVGKPLENYERFFGPVRLGSNL